MKRRSEKLLRHLKADYKPATYARLDQFGNRVSYRDVADKTGEYLRDVQFRKDKDEQWKHIPDDYIVRPTWEGSTGDFEMWKLEWAIDRLKRGKTPGPDGVHADLIKTLTGRGMDILLEIINSWLHEEGSEKAAC